MYFFKVLSLPPLTFIVSVVSLPRFIVMVRTLKTMTNFGCRDRRRVSIMPQRVAASGPFF